jgi:Leucine-rich repeat (LRR) protein
MQLVTLSLDNNRLATLPSSLGRLSCLKRLDAFNNALKRLPDAGCLGPLANLVELRLRHNQLVALPTDAGGMGSLQVP